MGAERSRKPAVKALAPYLWVGIGGFAGAAARYAVADAARWLLGPGFPFGTFLINVTGSFALGVLLTVLAARAVPYGDELRLALAVGFLGAYTTFSTFEHECFALLLGGKWFLAAAHMLGSLLLGLLAVGMGVALGKAWF